MENYLLNVRWKIETCNSGTDCWCRLIVPETPEDDGDYVIGDGSIGADVAEHLVKLHNDKIDALAKDKAKKAKDKKDKDTLAKREQECLLRQQTNLDLDEIDYIVDEELLKIFDEEGYFSYDEFPNGLYESSAWYGLSDDGFKKVITNLSKRLKIIIDKYDNHDPIMELIDKCKELIEKCKTQNTDGTYKL